MSKTKKIIIFGVTALILGALAFIYFSNSNSSNNTASTGGFSIKNFFPFGNPDEIVVTNTDNNSTDNTYNTQNDIDTSQTSVSDSNINKLRKISEKPVAGSIVYLQG